ncbi:MAG: GspH/FimT family pseudopilin [Candidatus Margulisiibacteriota bacterium]
MTNLGSKNTWGIVKNGYTIIELIIVLAIVAAMSAATITIISNAMNTMELSSAANKVVSDLRYAQNTASFTGKWIGITFEASPADQYTVYTTTGTQDIALVNPTKPSTAFTINLNSDFHVGISAVNISGGSQVEFSPIGTPYIDKTGAELAADGTITLNKGAATKTIHITPVTGRLFIQ